MKFKSLIVLTLLLVPALFSLPFGLAEDEVWMVENLSDMLGFVSSIEIHLTSDSGGSSATSIFSYELIGEELIEGSQAWKLNITMGDVWDLEDLTLWVDKASGDSVKIYQDGETYTGMMANMTGSMILLMFNVFTNLLAGYSYETMESFESSAYGTVTRLGTETHTYGPTTLTITGVEYSGHDPTGQSQLTFEVWYAPTQNGYIMTDLSVTSTTGGTSYISIIELNSITLTEDQIVPELPDEIPDEPANETSGDDTPVDDDTPDDSGNETTSDDNTTDDTTTEDTTEQTEGGGIPGFPTEALILGIALIVLVLQRKH